jgi:Cft2 family RNA processing exonuclease/beta-phosphoglucomutase-like phosphatase (HAD superfamily)/ADP-ribose pyrophosphatase YjhB (NUDIX family)/1-acyl-sn-glycerol-3-phosphate acyltransferase
VAQRKAIAAEQAASLGEDEAGATFDAVVEDLERKLEAYLGQEIDLETFINYLIYAVGRRRAEPFSQERVGRAFAILRTKWHEESRIAEAGLPVPGAELLSLKIERLDEIEKILADRLSPRDEKEEPEEARTMEPREGEMFQPTLLSRRLVNPFDPRMKGISLVLRLWYTFYYLFLRHYVTFEGIEHVLGLGRHMFAGNHMVVGFDGVLFSSAHFSVFGEQVLFVSKPWSSGQFKPLGWVQRRLIWGGGAIVAEEHGTVHKVVEHLHRDAKPIAFFPGKPSKHPLRYALTEWRHGVAVASLESGVPIVPFALSGKLPVRWTPRQIFLALFAPASRMRLKIKFGPPIYAPEKDPEREEQQAEELLGRVQQGVASLLDGEMINGVRFDQARAHVSIAHIQPKSEEPESPPESAENRGQAAIPALTEPLVASRRQASQASSLGRPSAAEPRYLMGEGDAVHQASGIQRLPLDRARIDEIVAVLEGKLGHLPAKTRGKDRDQARRAAGHLRKLVADGRMEGFDELRWAYDKANAANRSYLLGVVEKDRLALGRGFFDTDGFTNDQLAQLLFRAALESLALESGAGPEDPGNREEIDRLHRVVFRRNTLAPQMEKFIALQDLRFFASAVERFNGFSEGFSYFRTVDLFRAWMEADQKGNSLPAIQQAAYLNHVLVNWVAGESINQETLLRPGRMDEEKRQLAIKAYFKVLLPLSAFAVFRNQFYGAVKDIREERLNVRRQATLATLARPGRAVKPSRPQRKAGFNDNLPFYLASPVPIAPLAADLAKGVPKSLPERLEHVFQIYTNLAEQALAADTWLKRKLDELALHQAPDRAQPENKVRENELPGMGWVSTEFIAVTYQHMALQKFGERQPALNLGREEPVGFGLYQHERATDRKENPAAVSAVVGAMPVSSMFLTPAFSYYSYDPLPGGRVYVERAKQILLRDMIGLLEGDASSVSTKRADIQEFMKHVLALRAELTGQAFEARHPAARFTLRGRNPEEWLERSVELAEISDAAFWQMVLSHYETYFRFMAVESGALVTEEERALFWYYSLFTHPRGLFAWMAGHHPDQTEPLRYVPGTNRLTDDSAKLLLDAILGLHWSGPPRKDAGTGKTALYEAFLRFVWLTPDGVFISDPEAFERFLTEDLTENVLDVPDSPLEAFERWKAANFPEGLGDGRHELEGYREMDPVEGHAAVYPVPGEKPAFHHSREFTPARLLKPSEWPWAGKLARVAVYTGSYQNGLHIPGTPFKYRIDGVADGTILRVIVTEEGQFTITPLDYAGPNIPVLVRTSLAEATADWLEPRPTWRRTPDPEAIPETSLRDLAQGPAADGFYRLSLDEKGTAVLPWGETIVFVASTGPVDSATERQFIIHSHQGAAHVYSSDGSVYLAKLSSAGHQVLRGDKISLAVRPALPPLVGRNPVRSTEDYDFLKELGEDAALKAVVGSGMGYGSLILTEGNTLRHSGGTLFIPRSLVSDRPELARTLEQYLARHDPLRKLKQKHHEITAFESSSHLHNGGKPIPDMPPFEPAGDWPADAVRRYEREYWATRDARRAVEIMRGLGVLDQDTAQAVRKRLGDLFGEEPGRDSFLFLPLEKRQRITEVSSIDRPYQGVGWVPRKHLQISSGHFDFKTIASSGTALKGLDPEERFLFVRLQGERGRPVLHIFRLDTGEPHHQQRHELEEKKPALVSAVQERLGENAWFPGLLDEFLNHFDSDGQVEVVNRLADFLPPLLNPEHPEPVNFALIRMIFAEIQRIGASRVAELAEALRAEPPHMRGEDLHLLLMYFDLDPTDIGLWDPARFDSFLTNVLVPSVLQPVRFPWQEALEFSGPAAAPEPSSTATSTKFFDELANRLLAIQARVQAMLASDPLAASSVDYEWNGEAAVRHRLIRHPREAPSSVHEFFIGDFFRRREREAAEAEEQGAEETGVEAVPPVVEAATAAAPTHPPLSARERIERATHVSMLGGLNIGGSSAEVAYRSTRIIWDAGEFPENPGEIPDLRRIRHPQQAVFLSHSHADHVGAAVAYARYFREHFGKDVPFFVTPGTAALLEQGLMVGARTLAKMKRRGRSFAAPRFTETEVREFLARNVVVVPPVGMADGRPIYPAIEISPEMKVQFVHAGHLLGAVSLIVMTPDGNTFLSGDVSEHDQGPVKGYAPWAEDIPIHTALLEVSSGMRELEPDAAQETQLLQDVEQAMERARGRGKILIAASSRGRAQRVLHLLLRRFGNRLPIYVDGEAAAVTKIYQRFFPGELEGPEVFVVEKRERWEELRRDRKDILARPQPAVIIASSTDGSPGSASGWYAAEMVSDPRNTIIVTGRTDRHLPAHRLLQAQEGEMFRFESGDRGYEVRAARISRKLNGHAVGSQTLALLDRMKPRRVILGHGDNRAKQEVLIAIRDRHREMNPLIPWAQHFRSAVFPENESWFRTVTSVAAEEVIRRSRGSSLGERAEPDSGAPAPRLQVLEDAWERFAARFSGEASATISALHTRERTLAWMQVLPGIKARLAERIRANRERGLPSMLAIAGTSGSAKTAISERLVPNFMKEPVLREAGFEHVTLIPGDNFRLEIVPDDFVIEDGKTVGQKLAELSAAYLDRRRTYFEAGGYIDRRVAEEAFRRAYYDIEDFNYRLTLAGFRPFQMELMQQEGETRVMWRPSMDMFSQFDVARLNAFLEEVKKLDGSRDVEFPSSLPLFDLKARGRLRFRLSPEGNIQILFRARDGLMMEIVDEPRRGRGRRREWSLEFRDRGQRISQAQFWEKTELFDDISVKPITRHVRGKARSGFRVTVKGSAHDLFVSPDKQRMEVFYERSAKPMRFDEDGKVIGAGELADVLVRHNLTPDTLFILDWMLALALNPAFFDETVFLDIDPWAALIRQVGRYTGDEGGTGGRLAYVRHRQMAWLEEDSLIRKTVTTLKEEVRQRVESARQRLDDATTDEERSAATRDMSEALGLGPWIVNTERRPERLFRLGQNGEITHPHNEIILAGDLHLKPSDFPEFQGSPEQFSPAHLIQTRLNRIAEGTVLEAFQQAGHAVDQVAATPEGMTAVSDGTYVLKYRSTPTADGIYELNRADLAKRELLKERANGSVDPFLIIDFKGAAFTVRNLDGSTERHRLGKVLVKARGVWKSLRERLEFLAQILEQAELIDFAEVQQRVRAEARELLRASVENDLALAGMGYVNTEPARNLALKEISPEGIPLQSSYSVLKSGRRAYRRYDPDAYYALLDSDDPRYRIPPVFRELYREVLMETLPSKEEFRKKYFNQRPIRKGFFRELIRGFLTRYHSGVIAFLRKLGQNRVSRWLQALVESYGVYYPSVPSVMTWEIASRQMLYLQKLMLDAKVRHMRHLVWSERERDPSRGWERMARWAYLFKHTIAYPNPVIDKVMDYIYEDFSAGGSLLSGRPREHEVSFASYKTVVLRYFPELGPPGSLNRTMVDLFFDTLPQHFYARGVILDYDGVLYQTERLQEVWKEAFRREFGKKMDQEEFDRMFREIVYGNEALRDLRRRALTGEADFEAYVDKLNALFRERTGRRGAVSKDVYINAVREGERLIEGAKEFVRDLKEAGIRVMVLSDQYAGTGSEERVRANLERDFPGAFSPDDILFSFSREVRARKKDGPGAFRAALAKLGLDADEVLFIDDREENTQVARGIGLSVFVYDHQAHGPLAEKVVASRPLFGKGYEVRQYEPYRVSTGQEAVAVFRADTQLVDLIPSVQPEMQGRLHAVDREMSQMVYQDAEGHAVHGRGPVSSHLWPDARHVQNMPEHVFGYIANDNLFANRHFVLWHKGRIYYPVTAEGAEDVENRSYSSLVYWKDRRVSIQDVRYKLDDAADPFEPHARIFIGDRDVTDEVIFATFGQRLVKTDPESAVDAVTRVDLATLIGRGEFQDLRHVFQLPLFTSMDFSDMEKDVAGGGVYLGLEQLAQNHYALAAEAYHGPVMLERRISYVSSSGRAVTRTTRHEKLKTKNLKKKLESYGYREVEKVRDRGEFRFDPGTERLEIFLKLDPYPHTMVGIDGKGNFMAVAVSGKSGRHGPTLEEMQEIAVRKDMVDAILLVNGGSSRMAVADSPLRRSRDQLLEIAGQPESMVMPSSEGRYYSPALIFFGQAQPGASSLGKPSVLAGSTFEALEEAVENIEPEKIARARLSHEKYEDPLISVVNFITRPDGGLLLAKRAGTRRWSLIEEEAVLGEDYQETASRAIRPWLFSDKDPEKEMIGFISDPERFPQFYAYTAAVRLEVPSEARIRLPRGYQEARFFTRGEISLQDIVPSHRGLVKKYWRRGRLEESAPKISSDPAKVRATRRRHVLKARERKTHPNVDVQGIVEVYGEDGEFKGILLLQRGKGAGQGQWATPGGHPHAGENAVHAFLRELREETALVGKKVRLLWLAEKRSPAYRTSYWTLFLVSQARGAPRLDGIEATDSVLIPSRQALAAFAQDHVLSWDVPSALTRYFAAKEKEDASSLGRIQVFSSHQSKVIGNTIAWMVKAIRPAEMVLGEKKEELTSTETELVRDIHSNISKRSFHQVVYASLAYDWHDMMAIHRNRFRLVLSFAARFPLLLLRAVGTALFQTPFYYGFTVLGPRKWRKIFLDPLITVSDDNLRFVLRHELADYLGYTHLGDAFATVGLLQDRGVPFQKDALIEAYPSPIVKEILEEAFRIEAPGDFASYRERLKQILSPALVKEHNRFYHGWYRENLPKRLRLRFDFRWRTLQSLVGLLRGGMKEYFSAVSTRVVREEYASQMADVAVIIAYVLRHPSFGAEAHTRGYDFVKVILAGSRPEDDTGSSLGEGARDFSDADFKQAKAAAERFSFDDLTAEEIPQFDAYNDLTERREGLEARRPDVFLHLLAILAFFSGSALSFGAGMLGPAISWMEALGSLAAGLAVLAAYLYRALPVARESSRVAEALKRLEEDYGAMRALEHSYYKEWVDAYRAWRSSWDVKRLRRLPFNEEDYKGASELAQKRQQIFDLRTLLGYPRGKDMFLIHRRHRFDHVFEASSQMDSVRETIGLFLLYAERVEDLQKSIHFEDVSELLEIDAVRAIAAKQYQVLTGLMVKLEHILYLQAPPAVQSRGLGALGRMLVSLESEVQALGQAETEGSVADRLKTLVAKFLERYVNDYVLSIFLADIEERLDAIDRALGWLDKAADGGLTKPASLYGRGPRASSLGETVRWLDPAARTTVTKEALSRHLLDRVEQFGIKRTERSIHQLAEGYIRRLRRLHEARWHEGNSKVRRDLHRLWDQARLFLLSTERFSPSRRKGFERLTHSVLAGHPRRSRLRVMAFLHHLAAWAETFPAISARSAGPASPSRHPRLYQAGPAGPRGPSKATLLEDDSIPILFAVSDPESAYSMRDAFYRRALDSFLDQHPLAVVRVFHIGSRNETAAWQTEFAAHYGTRVRIEAGRREHAPYILAQWIDGPLVNQVNALAGRRTVRQTDLQHHLAVIADEEILNGFRSVALGGKEWVSMAASLGKRSVPETLLQGTAVWEWMTAARVAAHSADTLRRAIPEDQLSIQGNRFRPEMGALRIYLTSLGETWEAVQETIQAA